MATIVSDESDPSFILLPTNWAVPRRFQSFRFIFGFINLAMICLRGFYLYLSCLGFAELIGFIILRLSPNWGNFQPLSPQVFFFSSSSSTYETQIIPVLNHLLFKRTLKL